MWEGVVENYLRVLRMVLMMGVEGENLLMGV